MSTTAAGPLAPPRGVDLWTVTLDQPAAREARLVASCSAGEHARAARMPIAGRRRDFLVGRGIVRSVLGAYLGISPGRIEIAAGVHGKPFVDARDAPAFNVSHSHGLAVLAVTAGFDVGIDLERVDPSLDVVAIARWLASPEESAHLPSLGDAASATAFLRLWTRKEARAKAGGAGFSAGLGELSAPSPGSASPSWDGTRTIVDIDPAPGYVGALAYDAPPAPLYTPDHALACL
ncbi:MAG: 4'-phosphopantetheinyl transferase superfamily protein [Actinomycetota bacterium]|nr:4'-phosphopantetheinyl transferase superfamily protein [Actinomycetota bacterium]